MKKKDIFLFICFVIVLEKIFMEQNFGFVPLNNAEALGYDLIPAIAFAGAVWFIFDFVTALKNKNKKSEATKLENK